MRSPLGVPSAIGGAAWRTIMHRYRSSELLLTVIVKQITAVLRLRRVPSGAWPARDVRPQRGVTPTVLAISDLCHRCRLPLTAEHVLHGGAPHCYRCELQLLRAHDLAAAAAPAWPRRWGRLALSGRLPGPLDRSDAPRDAVAARRHGPGAGRRRRVAA